MAEVEHTVPGRGAVVVVAEELHNHREVVDNRPEEPENKHSDSDKKNKKLEREEAGDKKLDFL